MKIQVLIVLVTTILVVRSVTPVVIWHGLGDNACFPFSMGYIKQLIEDNIPGIYVYLVELGGDCVTDEYEGYISDVNSDIETVAATLAADPQLQNGFHAMGFSQGAQFLRAYVQRYNNPPVFNLISVGGQHQGVYGFPKCPGANITLCNYVRELLDIGAYVSYVQDILVPAQYWHDPLDVSGYLEDCHFLPDVNNALPQKNQTYVQNLQSLIYFVMVRFEFDTVVQPIASEWFGFYIDGQDVETQTLFESQLYKEDWLGLQLLNDSGRLQFLSCPGDHLQFTEPWFISNIIPYLAMNGSLLK